LSARTASRRLANRELHPCDHLRGERLHGIAAEQRKAQKIDPQRRAALPCTRNDRTSSMLRPAPLVDMVVVIAGYLLAYLGARASNWPSPGALAIVAGVLLASWRLRARAESWRAVGLRRPVAWRWTLLAVIVIYFAVVAAVTAIVRPLANALGWPELDLSAFGGLPGEPLKLAVILLIVWTTAAVGEELLFRGFLLTRIEQLLGSGRVASAGAVALQAAIFGFGHFYLGTRGVATAVFVGLIYGGWYVLRGRELVPLILAHGLTDTISMLAIYAGAVEEVAPA
jgi:membrane protease YdiL (CAAX protease family)